MKVRRGLSKHRVNKPVIYSVTTLAGSLYYVGCPDHFFVSSETHEKIHRRLNVDDTATLSFHGSKKELEELLAFAIGAGSRFYCAGSLSDNGEKA